MTMQNRESAAADSSLSDWYRPTVSAFDISEVTLLGKLGSLFDADTQTADYSPD